MVVGRTVVVVMTGRTVVVVVDVDVVAGGNDVVVVVVGGEVVDVVVGGIVVVLVVVGGSVVVVVVDVVVVAGIVVVVDDVVVVVVVGTVVVGGTVLVVVVVDVVVVDDVTSCTKRVTCEDHPEYIPSVSLSARTSNTYDSPKPPVFSKILKGRVYSVFKAFSSPTLPVATPQPASGGMRNDIAYLSGSTLPVLGASQSRNTPVSVI